MELAGQLQDKYFGRCPAVGDRLIKQHQVDGVAHLAIPEIARVQPVTAIVDRQHLGRTRGVAQRLIEIDDAIQGTADYVVTRDDDLLSLETQEGITIATPEAFLAFLRSAE